MELEHWFPTIIDGSEASSSITAHRSLTTAPIGIEERQLPLYSRIDCRTTRQSAFFQESFVNYRSIIATAAARNAMKHLLATGTAIAAISTSACSAQNYGAPTYAGGATSLTVAGKSHLVSKAATVYISGTSGIAVYNLAGQYLRTVKLPYGQIAVDSMDNLYAHEHTNKVIRVYEQRGKTVAWKVLTKGDHYLDLWLDDSANIYVDCGAKNLCEYGANDGGFVREIRGHNYSPAFDAAGDMYTITSDSSIAFYVPGATSPERTITNGAGLASYLAVDPQGNLYVLSNYIGSELSPHINVYASGASSPSRTITDGLTIGSMMTIDNAGTLYVLNECSGTAHCTNAQNSVAIYAFGSSAPEKIVTDALHYPSQIAVDSSSNLYVSNPDWSTGTGDVTEYSAGDYSLLRTLTQGLVQPSSIAITPST